MEKNELYLKQIIKENKTISYDYELGEEWKNKLNEKEKMYAKYELDVTNVPDSIAVIPFLSNILPIAWIFNLKIVIPELDSVFYNSVENIKSGYKNMYPKLKFNGKLVVEKIINNENKSYMKSAVLFSGGVDAFNTLLNHHDEKPDIITIFGADISLKDKQGMTTVNQKNKETAIKLGIDYYAVYSNFRESINYSYLSNYVAEKINCEWWHDFQHGIALIGLATPLAHMNKYSKVYIASSFTANDIGNYTCASDPTIDNHFKYSNTVTIHDGYEFSRQDKIHNICQFIKKNNIIIKLRVCWISNGGENCCSCEKCYRTIMGIIAEGGNPIDYGFELNNKLRKKMIKYLKKNLKYDTKNLRAFKYIPIQHYIPIQSRFNKNYKLEDTPKDLIWFRNIKIASKDRKMYYFIKKFIKQGKSKVKGLVTKK